MSETSTFVQARGATKRRVAFGVGGAAGAAIGSTGPKGDQGDPAEALGPSGLGHLVVREGEVVLYKAKAGLRAKGTDEVLLRTTRDSVQSATLDKKALMGILSVAFTDGSSWEFDVPRPYLKSAAQVASTLGG